MLDDELARGKKMERILRTSACRAAAEDLRAIAGTLDGAISDHLAAWEGTSRIEFDGATSDIAADLLSEAAELDASADAIDVATQRARSAETTRRLAHERAQHERAQHERAQHERAQHERAQHERAQHEREDRERDRCAAGAP